jgi:hypothetical protein
MRYLNNWITQLTADFPPDAVALPVDTTYFGLLGAAEYLLTLVNSINPIEQTAWEIIKVTITSDSVTVERAQEDTTAQYWTAGSTIYCGFTAGGMNEILGQVATLTGQVASLILRVAALESATPETPDGGLVDQSNNGLVDDQANSLTGENLDGISNPYIPEPT